MKKVLFLLLFLINIGLAKGTHMAGADVRYVSLGGTKYKVIAKIYRLCNAIALSNPTGGLFVSNASGTSCGYIFITFTRTAIKDVGIYCDTTKKCNPANSWVSSVGFEEHTYEVTVDLASSSVAALLSSTCNVVTFSIAQCCRDNQTTTTKSESFMATATLYYGTLANLKVKTNNSPYFLSTPGVNYCCNNPVYQDFEAKDTFEADVLTYKLVPALRDFGVDVTYNSPWSGDYPLTPYCPGKPGKLNCTPSPYKTLPEGIYLDTTTGEFIYTPTKCGEIGPVVVEVSEYRKTGSGLVLVGKMRRDILIKSRDCGQNRAPEILSDFEYGVCAGDSLCFEVKTLDTFKNNMGKLDTLKMFYSTNIKNAKITTSAGNGREPTLKFCWKSSNNDFSETPYTLKIEVRDQNCPVPSISFRNIKIKILKSTTVSLNTKFLSCNRLQLEAKSSIQLTRAKYQWIIRDSLSGDTLLNSTLSSPVTTGLNKGTYIITMLVSSSDFCAFPIKRDTIRIASPIPYLTLPLDTQYCENTVVNLKPAIYYSKKPYIVSWTLNKKQLKDSTLNISYKVQPKRDTFNVKLIDSNGCVSTDNMVISGLMNPKVSWNKDTFDTVCFRGQDLDISSYYKTQAGVKTFEINTKDSAEVSLIKNQWFFQLSKVKNCDYDKRGNVVSVYLYAEDSIGCYQRDTAIIPVYCLPDWKMKDDTLCQISSDYYQLKNMGLNYYDPTQYLYHFRLIDWPKTVDSSLVISDVSGVGTNWKFYGGFHRNPNWFGTYQIEGCKTNKKSGCMVCDTAKIEVVGNSDFEFTNNRSYCSKIETIDLWTLIKKNGNNLDNLGGTISIHSLNGDKNSKNWGSAKMENNQKFHHGNTYGKWVFRIEESVAKCTNTDTFFLIVHPSPIAKFSTSPKDSALISKPVFQTNNLSTIANGTSILNIWDPGTGNVNDRSNAINPVFNYPFKNAMYTIRLETKSNQGCLDTAEQMVVVYEEISSIASIQPTKYKVNEKVQLLDFEFKEIKTLIYNTTGQLIAQFENNTGYQSPQSGVYQYVIICVDLKGVQHIIKGKVLLD